MDSSNNMQIYINQQMRDVSIYQQLMANSFVYHILYYVAALFFYPCQIFILLYDTFDQDWKW